MTRSECEITMETYESYNLLKVLLDHNKRGSGIKNFDCTDERPIWEDEIKSDLPGLKKARAEYRQRKKLHKKEKLRNLLYEDK